MTGFSSEVRELVILRAGAGCEPGSWPTCEVQVRCQGRAFPVWELHHRRPRAAGGSRLPETNQAANALGACADCHRFIEANRALARRNGWLVRQGREPLNTPVLRRGIWVYLNNIGGFSAAAVPCACGLYESEHLSVSCPCSVYVPDAETA